MATNRPLLRLTISDLESVFEKQPHNTEVLARLKHELSHRQVPRAIALLERIHQAEGILIDPDNNHLGAKTPSSSVEAKRRTTDAQPAGASSSKSTSASAAVRGQSRFPEQQDLLTGLLPPEVSNLSSPVAASAPAPESAPVKKTTVVAQPQALPQLALEDACRILKVAAYDSWEKVEAARRKIVMKSSPLTVKGLPETQAQKLLEEAQMANDAAIVIAARRSGRQ